MTPFEGEWKMETLKNKISLSFAFINIPNRQRIIFWTGGKFRGWQRHEEEEQEEVERVTKWNLDYYSFHFFFPPEKTQRQSEEKVFLCFYFQLYHSSSYLRILLFVDSVSNRGRNLCAMVSFPSFQMLSIKFAVKEAEKTIEIQK